MALSAGAKLGPYIIEALLGEGGMGTVYRARDARLERTVALKVLRADRSDLQLDLLLREARSASALNHANIVAVHDIGNAGGTDFIVMEHVPGKSLDRLIPRQGLRPAEGLKVATQIADALAAAHAAGIIHRDLKPSNIIVTEGGQAKLLDFGLARAQSTAAPAAEGDTATAATGLHSTDGGAIAGTLSYMSPEQAEGKKLDSRSDIFSFGAVLYEMVTGERAFRGETPASTISSILRDDPKPPSRVISDVPRELERVIHRCLRKDPDRRFQTAADLKVELLELKEESDSGRLFAAAPAVPAPRRRVPRGALYLAAGGLLLASAVGIWLWWSGREPLGLPADARVRPLTSFPGVEDQPALSPDGRQVAFSWKGAAQDNWDLYVMLAGGGKALRLTADPSPDQHPAWSPDGQNIAFARGRGADAALMVVSALGGPERKLTDLPSVSPVAWGPRGRSIFFTDHERGIAAVDAESGELTRLTSPPIDGTDVVPRVSADGRMLAFIRRITVSNGRLFLMPLDSDGKSTGDAREVKQFSTYMDGLDWTQDGRSVLLSTGSLASSEIVRVYLDGRTVILPLGLSAFLPSVSGKGNALAFAQRLYDPNVWALEPASGRARRVVASTALDLSAAPSPDGRRLVFVSTRSGSFDLWTSDAGGGDAAKLTYFGKHVGAPVWSPDGTRIAFDSARDGRWHVYVIGSGGGAARQLTFGDNTNVRPSWSPDGQWIYFGTDRSGQWRIFKVAAGGGEPVQVTRQGGSEAFVPGEGGFIYYAHQGQPGIWRMPLNGGPEVKVIDKARQSWWGVSRTGIYYVDADGPRHVVELYSFASRKIAQVCSLPEGTNPYPQAGRGFAVSSDGKILLYTAVDSEQGDLYLVENFR